ncbi:MAG: hypothetical protein LBT10_02280, partial [Methanobrevibacter sp.]|nr:hypothetical protein [Methanobrevibacter sp.]
MSFTACSDDDGYPSPHFELETKDFGADTGTSIPINMSRVPENIHFPTGLTNNTIVLSGDAYWIAETEVTYELWNAVKT